MKKLQILLLLLVAMTTFSQTYSIKLDLEKGKTYPLVINVGMDIKQNVMGQEVPIKMNMQISSSYKVLSQDNDVYTLEGIYRYFGMKMDVMGRAMNMDSEDKTNPAYNTFSSLVNIPYQLIVKSNGDVVDVIGYEKIVDNLKKSLPQGASGADQLSKNFSKESVIQNFKSTFFSIPPQPVKIGDTWKANYIINSNGIDLNYDITCKLESADDAKYKITYTGAIVAKEGTKIQQNGMDVNIKKMEGTNNGTVILDKTSAWVKSNESKGKINGLMSVSMQGKDIDILMDMDMDAKTSDILIAPPPPPMKTTTESAK